MIKSRKQAIEDCDKCYSTGKPCKRGHIAERRTTTGQCIECERAYQRTEKAREYTRNKINTEEYKTQREKYRKSVMSTDRYKLWSKTTHLRRTYDLTLDEYNSICEAQGGKCGICVLPFVDDDKCVDHCHKTGKIRGLVCHSCNKLLGFAYDDSNILQQAIAYLENNRLT